jgi:hypothetical protein
MPSVSARLPVVAAAIDHGITVTAVPGLGVLTALAISGLPVDRFCFEVSCPQAGGAPPPSAGLAAEPAPWSSSRRLTAGRVPHRRAAAFARIVRGRLPRTDQTV